MTNLTDTRALIERVHRADTIRMRGHVVRVVGLLAESIGPPVSVGEVCLIRTQPAAGPTGGGKRRSGDTTEVLAEVVGFRDGRVLLMPLDRLDGLAPGCEVTATGRVLDVPVGDALLGRVIDGLGRPLDGGPTPLCETRRSLDGTPPPAMQRRRLDRPLATGLRVIDGMMTLAEGQRVGVFAGSGVGKSVLLGMIARQSAADICVVGLVGERGREVREFIERDLGDGRQRAVVVVSTSDEPALRRLTAAKTTIAVAEHFRDRGHRVLLLMDSLTRVAMAQREVGLAVGEPPATRGYPPSVFAMLPQLLERSGMGAEGSITGIYAVLVEGDDMMDPIADTVRSILDGHLVLSRSLANRGHYPALDPLESISRSMADLLDGADRRRAEAVRSLLARYRDAEDLIQIGAYAPGSDPAVDLAIELKPEIDAFLCQDRDDSESLDGTWERLRELGDRVLAGRQAGGSDGGERTNAADGKRQPPGARSFADRRDRMEVTP